LAGTTYNVDFAKAATGPQLVYAQYAVGTTSGGTDVINWTDIFRSNVDSYDTNWAVDFTNLHEGTNYVSVRVEAEDGLTAQLNGAFTILKDTVTPEFSSFVSAPTANAATLSWTTTEPATTQLEYGTTTAYGSTTTVDSTLTTSHSVSLSGLAETTTFHARALGADAAGNAGVSADLEFATAAGAHTYISDVQVTAVSSTSVTVTWTTNEPATSKVRYGLSAAYGLEAYDATLTTSHRVTLTGLTPSTEYHYEVISVGSTTDHDADATFDTAATSITATVSTPTVNSVILPPQLNDPLRVVFTGYGGQRVTIYLDGRPVRNINLTGSTSKKKSFVVNIKVSQLTSGSHYISLRATNAQGQVSSFTRRIKFTVNRQQEKFVMTSRTGKYIVQPGDSLWSIAKRFLGRGEAYPRLVQANLKQLPALASNPALIQPGVTIIIPAK
jgi:nucleoid-associated protein YgaU